MEGQGRKERVRKKVANRVKGGVVMGRGKGQRASLATRKHDFQIKSSFTATGYKSSEARGGKGAGRRSTLEQRLSVIHPGGPE